MNCKSVLEIVYFSLILNFSSSSSPVCLAAHITSYFLPPSPFRAALIFPYFSQWFNTCSSQHGPCIPLWLSFLSIFDSLSLYVHHSWRWLKQRRGSAVRPVGFQGPAETRAGLFVRKWFSRCWGGHSKSSLAISVMALRCCCLCPVMVTDDWLGRRGPARRPSKGAKKTSTCTHTNTCIKHHSTGGPCDCR